MSVSGKILYFVDRRLFLQTKQQGVKKYYSTSAILGEIEQDSGGGKRLVRVGSFKNQIIRRTKQFLTLEYAKQKLADSGSLLHTAFDSGFSGPSRLHDLFVTFEAMTPGEFKKRGAGLKIAYGSGAVRMVEKATALGIFNNLLIALVK